jgi:signal transduction histidine kinase
VPAHAELAIPIHLGGEVYGVLNVESDRPFDDEDQLSLETIADFLALGMRNLRLIAAAREGAVRVERQRLARELHDNVTQILSSISLLSQTLDSAWRRDPAEGSRRVARLQQLAQTAFAEMRMLLRELVPPPPSAAPVAVSRRSRAFAGLERLRDHALPGALQRLLESMVPEEIQLGTEFSGYVPQRLEFEESLYRVCQEAVSNVVRHSGARHLQVTVAVTEDHAVLRVADDGRGIGTEFRPGLGLSSMRERLETHGGLLRITPNTPRGTLIEGRVPRKDRNASPAAT